MVKPPTCPRKTFQEIDLNRGVPLQNPPLIALKITLYMGPNNAARSAYTSCCWTCSWHWITKMLGNSGIWAQNRKICTCLGSLRMGDVRFFFSVVVAMIQVKISDHWSPVKKNNKTNINRRLENATFLMVWKPGNHGGFSWARRTVSFREGKTETPKVWNSETPMEKSLEIDPCGWKRFHGFPFLMSADLVNKS